MREAARPTQIKRDFRLAGEPGQLFAFGNRSDDYLELVLPNRRSIPQDLRDALTDLSHSMDPSQPGIRFYEGPPAIIGVLHLRPSADSRESLPFEERLTSMLARLSKAVPAFDFGDLLPSRLRPAEQIQPLSFNTDPGPAGEAAPSPEAAASSIREEAQVSSRPTQVAGRSLQAIRQEARRGQLHRALKALDEILGCEPGHAEARRLKEELRLLERREKRRRREPGNAQAHLEAGFSYLLFERNEEAVHAFARATRIDPNQYLSHLLLGIALHREGQVEGARTAYRKAGRLRPNDNGHVDLLQALERGEPPLPVAETSPITRTRRPSTSEMQWVQSA